MLAGRFAFQVNLWIVVAECKVNESGAKVDLGEKYAKLGQLLSLKMEVASGIIRIIFLK